MAEENVEKIKYTFLLPAYKASFLLEALNSLKGQSYSHFKVIVSDDCSPEDLKSTFDFVVGSDSRFVYRRNEENMGGKSLVSHWNLLVDLCDTEYLIMASDDDVYEIDFLFKIDLLVRKYPKVNVLRAKARRLENDVVVLEDGNIPEFLSLDVFLPYFGGKKMVECLANYVFKTSSIKEIGGFPDFPKAGYSDAAVAMALAKNGLVTTKDVLFSFRISSDNLSSVNGYNKYAKEGIKACVQFSDWYKINIEPFIGQAANINEITQAHKKHVVEVAQYFLCHLPLLSTLKYYMMLRSRGYMNVKSLLTAIKNLYKIR